MFFKLKKIMSYMLVGSFAIGGMYGIGSNNTYGSAPATASSTGGGLTASDTTTINGVVYERNATSKIVTVYGFSNDEGAGSLTEIEIESKVNINKQQYTVTAISDDAFDNFDKVTSVTIPATIETIGKEAFYGCAKLQTVTFEKDSKSKTTALKEIKKSAFEECPSLTTINLEANGELEKIGDSAFAKCLALHKIIIPKNVRMYGKYIFAGSGLCGDVVAGIENKIIFQSHKSIIPEKPTKDDVDQGYTLEAKDISGIFIDIDGATPMNLNVYFGVDDYALYREGGFRQGRLGADYINDDMYIPEGIEKNLEESDDVMEENAKEEYKKFNEAYEGFSDKCPNVIFPDVRCLYIETEDGSARGFAYRGWLTGGTFEGRYGYAAALGSEIGFTKEKQYIIGNFKYNEDNMNDKIMQFAKMFPKVSKYNKDVETWGENQNSGYWEIKVDDTLTFNLNTKIRNNRATDDSGVWQIYDYLLTTEIGDVENIKGVINNTNGTTKKKQIKYTFKNGKAPADQSPGPDSAMPGGSSTDFVSVSTESSSGSEFVDYHVDYHHEITADKPVDLSTIKSDADHVVIKKGDVYYTVEKQDFSGEAYNPTTSISTVDEKTLSAQTSEVQSLIKGVESKKSISNSKSVVLDVKDIHAKSSITFNLGEEYKGKIVAVSYIDQSKKESIGYAEFIVKDGSVTIKDIGKPCTFIFTIIK